MDNLNLEIAVDRRDLIKIKQACAEKIDVNHLSRTGNPLVYIAVLNAQKNNIESEKKAIEIIKELLKFPDFDINNKNTSFGYCALVAAITQNKLTIAEFLLECNADVNIQNKAGRTPLVEAVENKNLNAMNLLIKHKADINIPDKVGSSALCYAMTKTFIEGFELLLSKNVNISEQHSNQNSPVYNLCLCENKEMAQQFCNYVQKNNLLDIVSNQLEVVKKHYKNGVPSYFFYVKGIINSMQMNEKLSSTYEEKTSTKSLKI